MAETITSLRAQLAEAKRQIGELKAPITTGEDSRVVGLFARAARIAEYESHCPEYDDIADRIKAPGRERLRKLGMLKLNYDVEILATIHWTQTVKASDDIEAEAGFPNTPESAVRALNLLFPELGDHLDGTRVNVVVDIETDGAILSSEQDFD